MTYSVTIAEVINGLTVTNSATPYTVSISEIVNNIAITPPAANTIAITSTSYPVTVNYDAIIISGGGVADNGIPTGGTAGQILSKINSTNYNTQWINVPATGLQNVVEDTSPELGGNLDVNGFNIKAKAGAGTNSAGIYNATESAGFFVNNNGDVQLFATPNGSLALGDNIGVNAAFFLSGTGGFNFDSLGDNNFAAVKNVFGRTASPAKITTPSSSTSLTIDTNNGTNSGNIVINPGAGGNIAISPNGSGRVVVGRTSVSVATITTPTDASLFLNTNSGTNSGVIQISAGVNTDIKITPHGTGSVMLDGVKWPQADGPSGYVLATNGVGQTGWVSVSGAFNNSISYNLPTTDGAAKQVLKTDGMGSVTWQDEQATYVSESQPSTAKIGEQWFNPTTQILKVYTSVGWVQLTSDDQQY
jgi:hypothetical protein